MKVYDSVLQTIGNTPLIRLDRLTKGMSGHLFAKLEYWSPGLSKKDRVALRMIEDAERRGDLRPGQAVVELTSGNMGTGLAIACRLKGYRFIAVMSVGNSPERVKMMKAFGAEVVLVDQQPGGKAGAVTGRDLELVEAEACRISQTLGAFRANQFYNASTRKAGSLSIGPEIIAQLGEETPHAFVDFMGTGGSLIGVSQALKQRYPSIECFGVEPAAATYYGSTGGPIGQHRIQGGGYAMRLEFVEQYGDILDGFLTVTDQETMAATRRLALEECIFAGYSSGANVAAALKLLAGQFAGKSIIILTPDSGTKYLSTELWDDPA